MTDVCSTGKGVHRVLVELSVSFAESKLLEALPSRHIHLQAAMQKM